MPRITITEPGKTPQPYRLKTDREVTKIGRGSDNDIILENGSASTNHCEMLRVEGGFILKDNDSTNGILLDDTRFRIIDLEDGMTVSIGDDIDFNFELSEEELALLEEEDFEPHQQAAFPKSNPQPKKKPVELVEENDEYEEVVVRRKKKKKAVALDDEDDNFYEEEEIATPRTISPAKHSTPVAATKSGGIATTLIFAILAVAFLVGGMVIRHYQDHGTFLFDK